MVSVEREPITEIQGQSPWSGGEAPSPPLKLVTFLYSKCISCALLVAFCIGATTALCTTFANWAESVI